MALGKTIRWTAPELVTEGSQSPHFHFLLHRIKKLDFFIPNEEIKTINVEIICKIKLSFFFFFSPLLSVLVCSLFIYYLHSGNESIFFKKNK